MHSRELLDEGENRMKMETYRDQWQYSYSSGCEGVVIISKS